MFSLFYFYFFVLTKTRGKSTGKFIDSLRLMVRGGPGGMGHPKYGAN